jgi:long-subunit acyl-CoA synthetase (AMP-forming)
VAPPSDDVAGYMHTSGTEGLPKFCIQSHEYFLRLGRHFAGQLNLTAADRLLAPLPLFHINPFGYGFLGALSAAADFVGAERFSATEFWPLVVRENVTVLVLHGPPAAILKQRGRGDGWTPHRVRAMFYADAEFLETFEVGLGVSAYGSTEVGGISHSRIWRRGDRPSIPEPMSHYGGEVRHDLEWALTDDDEILVRGREPGAMFSGYMRSEGIDAACDADGWFHTGDVGRREGRDLVFIERRSESIRVKGEYVPIPLVERHFAGLPGVSDLALWKRPGALGGDQLDLYVVASELPVDAIRQAWARCSGVGSTQPRCSKSSHFDHSLAACALDWRPPTRRNRHPCPLGTRYLPSHTR